MNVCSVCGRIISDDEELIAGYDIVFCSDECLLSYIFKNGFFFKINSGTYKELNKNVVR